MVEVASLSANGNTEGGRSVVGLYGSGGFSGYLGC